MPDSRFFRENWVFLLMMMLMAVLPLVVGDSQGEAVSDAQKEASLEMANALATEVNVFCQKLMCACHDIPIKLCDLPFFNKRALEQFEVCFRVNLYRILYEKMLDVGTDIFIKGKREAYARMWVDNRDVVFDRYQRLPDEMKFGGENNIGENGQCYTV